MAFNVASINAYTNETAQGLIKQAVLAGSTMDYVTVVPGIKYKESLNILDNTVAIAAASCGWSPSGTVTFSQRDIEVTALEVKDALCEKTLEKYWMGQLMKAGAPKEDNQLGPVLAQSYIDGIKVENEKNIWQGVKGSTAVGVPNQFDGFYLSGLTAGYVGVAAAAGAHTKANIITHIDAMIAAAPDVLSTLPDLTMFMSVGNFRIMASALADKNYFNVNTNIGVQLEYTNPINGVRFVGMPGLVGSDNLILTYAANLVIGTDLVNEEEKFDIWYSRDNDEVRVNIQYKMGTQVQFPELVVLNKA